MCHAKGERRRKGRAERRALSMSSTKQPVVGLCVCQCGKECVLVHGHVGVKRISLAWPKGYLNVVNVFLRLNNKYKSITLPSKVALLEQKNYLWSYKCLELF